MSATFTNPWARWQQGLLEESSAALGRLTQFPTLAQRAQRVRKGVSPSEIVYEEDRLRVRHYLGSQKPHYRTPLVFIYALVNRPYILDLKPGRSVVANFVAQGFDTYLVDWGIPTDADRHLTLDDYVNGYMANVVDYLCERNGTDTVNVLGYCMGGTMSAMFTALRPERVKNLILLAAPIDFSTQDGLLNVWSRAEYFDVDRFVDFVHRVVPPDGEPQTGAAQIVRYSHRAQHMGRVHRTGFASRARGTTDPLSIQQHQSGL